jgi:hypothetical protein
MSVRLHWHIPLLTALADDVDRPARPVDTALRIDATDLVKPTSGAERESDEALEAQMERIQQQRLLVQRRTRVRALSFPRLMPRNGLRMS